VNKYQTTQQLNYLMNYLEWYKAENPAFISPMYDFDAEQDMVHKCEAGELLHVEEVITPHTEYYAL
jgi:hypothetical protein